MRVAINIKSKEYGRRWTFDDVASINDAIFIALKEYQVKDGERIVVTLMPEPKPAAANAL